MKNFLLLVSLCFLGSARAASAQSDEFLGSMDHQASVQQLSSDYFSLANPLDEALYETSSIDNTLSERGSSETAAAQHASGEPLAVEHASGPTPVDHATAVEHAPGEAAAGEHTLNEHTPGEQLSVEQPIGEQPLGEQSVGEQAVGEQPTNEQVASDKPAGEQSAVEPISAEQVSAESSAEQPSELPPSSTFSGPPLSCHTCSYMNDQGKCLRGEGVCSTQNSQQCMLKKIFEGGKLQFMVQGCENMCPSMNLFSHGTRMQIICCRNQSFCNKI
ncbi:acrosomal protein SP-10 isoform X1 [Bos indicus]|uniref:Acrosomal vesicle protein 1 n=3 Tax=Bos TaxID=9903 RepID=Q32KR2_BOVIN|nr:acrosomal protein SP-10 precursor [Bos taurus]XP_027388435.1 acrosomal protein SP-10-like isoform X1 [Bos indicus x Bos taurus]AAI09967.1 Acrosomal vesicle protein 1 [Bos taurus]